MQGPGHPLTPARARVVVPAAGAPLGSGLDEPGLRQCASSDARAVAPAPNRHPLAPSLGQPGSDLRRPADESCETVEASPGLPRGRAPRSTLRKLVFLRSAPQAGYIVLLRWTGEVAAGLPSPGLWPRPVPASRPGRLEAAPERGEWRRGKPASRPSSEALSPGPRAKAPLGVGEGQKGPYPLRSGPR